MFQLQWKSHNFIFPHETCFKRFSQQESERSRMRSLFLELCLMFVMNACNNNIGTFVKMGDNIKIIQTIKTVFIKSEQLYCVECNKKTQKLRAEKELCSKNNSFLFCIVYYYETIIAPHALHSHLLTVDHMTSQL